MSSSSFGNHHNATGGCEDENDQSNIVSNQSQYDMKPDLSSLLPLSPALQPSLMTATSFSLLGTQQILPPLSRMMKGNEACPIMGDSVEESSFRSPHRYVHY